MKPQNLLHFARYALPRGSGILGDHARVVKVPEERLDALLIGAEAVRSVEIPAPGPIGQVNKGDAVQC
jgi:hypothetical protein